MEEEKRIGLIKKLPRFRPAFVDVELRTLAGKALSRDGLGKLIVSWHDQRKTPGKATLLSIMSRATSYGGLVKIITTARTAADNLKILSLFDEQGARPIAFCMGSLGIFSRVMAMERGTPIAYGSLPGEPTAPGQPSIDQLLAMRRLLRNV